jgi:ABC-type uncharacterized transport system permease subunit
MILASASPLGVVLTLAAAVAYAVPAAAAARLSEAGARAALLAAWGLHAMALAWSLLGEQPRFGWASALSATGWLVLTVYVIERRVFPQLHARWALAVLGIVALLPPLLSPGVPVHGSGSVWLPLHLALGISSYGLFAAAAIHAWLMERAELSMRRGDGEYAGVPLLTLERLTFRFATAGFVLLSFTLLAGIFFSDRLYGRGWRWDHKTVFSLLAWLSFALLLVGRARFGLRGRRAVKVIYVGSMLLLLAYVGSRFVLEVVLRRGA